MRGPTAIARGSQVLALTILLNGCQALPSKQEGEARGVIFLRAEHCLSEYLRELRIVYPGPCLTVTGINGTAATPRPDGFVEVPVRQPVEITAECYYRHLDGSERAGSRTTVSLALAADRFTRAGLRWYLHAHTQAWRTTGCEPTLSRSIYPTYRSD